MLSVFMTGDIDIRSISFICMESYKLVYNVCGILYIFTVYTFSFHFGKLTSFLFFIYVSYIFLFHLIVLIVFFISLMILLMYVTFLPCLLVTK